MFDVEDAQALSLRLSVLPQARPGVFLLPVPDGFHTPARAAHQQAIPIHDSSGTGT
jgi:hypothetical protein